MGYLVNKTRVQSLTVNGVDYTSNLVSWTVSDSSANKNGIIQTTGSLILGNKPGGYNVEDYDRNNFKRGMPAILDITTPGGSVVRHPRGLLYVITTSYSPESLQLTVEIGCRLALAGLTENVSEVLSLVPVPLDPAQQTLSNISASFASAGMICYQNNTGTLQVNSFFQGDTTASVAAGEWTSVLGVTALSAGPLSNGGAVPDLIDLSYQYPSGALASNQTGKIDEVLTESYYFTTYPAIAYVRVAPATGLNGVSGVVSSPASTGTTSGCGNTPPNPGGNGCSSNAGYTLEQQPVILPSYRRDKAITEYSGPAGQISSIYNETRGPAIEANSQYWADKFAYCRYTWANACNPNGNCPFEGMDEVLLAYSEQLNYYGSANELVKTVVDNYETTMAAAQPFDWRSGVVDGIPQGFTTLDTSTMYRSSRIITEYSYSQNGNIQETTTYTSTTSRSTGINKGNLDALDGIKTMQRRTSTTISANPVIPDMVNSVTTNTEQKTVSLPLFVDNYTVPPSVSGPYVSKEQVPVPLLFTNASVILSSVQIYSDYITRFIKGDAFGVVVGEALRPEIVANWRPGMPFRFYDKTKGKVLALRMDACAWGATPDEVAVVTNGIWIGQSNGTVTINNNLVGDSRPNMGSGTTPPIGAGAAPSVQGETVVKSGAFAFNIDVFFMLSADMSFYGLDGVTYPFTSEVVNAQISQTVWVSGLVLQPGNLLAVDENGSLPLSANGSLVTTGATIVDADVFA
jgi:hypothetical protein